MMRISAPLRLCLALASLFTMDALVLAQQENLLSVDWGNSEIKGFVKDRMDNPRPSLLPQDEARLNRLRLPVLGFERAPSTVANSFAVGPVPEAKRTLVMDDKNPVWYQLVERYGDVTITIDADLRLQEDLPAGAQIYGRTPGAGEPVQVSILDGTTEAGMEGAIAEFVVYKYPNIPYRVTIECAKRSRDVCRDPNAIAKDSEFLKLLSARPPQ
jgi:hypothetical protein